MVRPGLSLYGLYPFNSQQRRQLPLKPVMSLKAKIGLVKEVPAGFKVSYGSRYITPRATRIATVPIGYADGYRRALSNQGEMLVAGKTGTGGGAAYAWTLPCWTWDTSLKPMWDRMSSS